jgi:hypothetical protein
VDGVPVALQRADEGDGDVVLVLDDQHTMRHAGIVGQSTDRVVANPATGG